jgi:hypothetical protein
MKTKLVGAWEKNLPNISEPHFMRPNINYLDINTVRQQMGLLLWTTVQACFVSLTYYSNCLL